MSNPMVELETSEGTIRLELYQDKAPKTTANFLQYVEEGFYGGTIFHRVIDGFMIQGGGLTPKMETKRTRPPVRNEARADLKNLRGTVAMARTNDIHSATAQFFINVADNDFLDHKDESSRGFGYAVFGRVIDGMDTVDRIRSVATKTVNGYADAPAEPVLIQGARRVEEEG
jgi:cyclophilin family peptidyl-prolyl cis-trans isomerase